MSALQDADHSSIVVFLASKRTVSLFQRLERLRPTLSRNPALIICPSRLMSSAVIFGETNTFDLDTSYVRAYDGKYVPSCTANPLL